MTIKAYVFLPNETDPLGIGTSGTEENGYQAILGDFSGVVRTGSKVVIQYESSSTWYVGEVQYIASIGFTYKIMASSTKKPYVARNCKIPVDVDLDSLSNEELITWLQNS